MANEEVNEKLMEALEEVEDPELGVDIVNLGLVYNVELDEESIARVTMTLTAMGCPLAGTITNDVRNALIDFDEVKEVDVNIVWNPPWTKDKMSRYAKIALGIQ
ncbi:metal-sulfur cluster assembly factor [Pseudalkalibacillus berkeleyi]|uniref:Metal-sulfur cluster assembly factor n=1 Tax=Pseudalkalibacillus berkeleyi TaxID=1069813 RepID=A0ABS9GYC5_9BACL|nr:metal-sulfur cluster assembly factor [Pseudalkalibacillus berkeleyi]MCF6136816.1 metal-sulfur cluster assembly factor [Pseudalkalibacillus berkeleyi]